MDIGAFMINGMDIGAFMYQAPAVGGLGIPIAMYHYSHNVGSKL